MSDRPRDSAWLVFYCARASEASYERTTLLRVVCTRPDPNDLPPEELLALAKRYAGTGEHGSTGVPLEGEIPTTCEAIRSANKVFALRIGTPEDSWYLFCGDKRSSEEQLKPTNWPATSGAFFGMMACWAASRDRDVAEAGYVAVLAKSRFRRGNRDLSVIKSFNRLFGKVSRPPLEVSWPFVLQKQASAAGRGSGKRKTKKGDRSLVVISIDREHQDKVLVLPDEPAEIIAWLYPDGIPRQKVKQTSRSVAALHLRSVQSRSDDDEHMCPLASGVVERPTHLNLGTLLNARFSFVEFFPDLRQREWTCLDAWCRNPSRISIGVITGPGGSGKTRLLIEWTRHLRGLPDIAWCAGFLPDSLSDAEIESMVSVERNTLIVIDYAESRLEQIESLFHRLHSCQQRFVSSSALGRIRIALLARGDGGWLMSLRERSMPLKETIDSGAAFWLTPIKADGDLRARVFGRARRDLALKLGTSPQPVSPELDGDEFSQILNIHLAALAAAQYRPIPALKLVEDALEHELHYWLRSRDQTEVRPFLRRAARLVAALTLRGCTALEELPLIDQRVNGPQQEVFRDFISDIYLAREVADGAHQFVHGLEPDRLGEAMVLRVLRDSETPPDYLERVLLGADEKVVEHVLTVLGRLESIDADTALKWIARALERPTASRAVAAVRAVLSVAKGSRLTRMGIILADSLRGVEDLLLADRIERAIPDNSVSLAHLAIWALGLSLREADSPLVRARLLVSMQSWLTSVGQFDKALAAASEAVEIYRQQTLDNVVTHSRDLASALSGYVVCLSAVGRHDDALIAAGEALEIERSLFAMDPKRELPLLIAKLVNFSQVSDNVGQLEQSRILADEAIALGRGLDLTEDPQSRLLLSNCLNNYGLTLRRLGRFVDALAVFREGIEVWRKAAEMRPDECLPHYAAYLNNQGLVLEALHRPTDAIDAARKSVEIFRDLAMVVPTRYLPLLANSLVTLALGYRTANQPRLGLSSAEEADDIYRRLREYDPGRYVEPLVTCTRLIADALRILGRSIDAIAEFRKCLDLHEVLHSSLSSNKKACLASLRDVLSAYEAELPRAGMRPQVDPFSVRVRTFLSEQERRCSLG